MSGRLDRLVVLAASHAHTVSCLESEWRSVNAPTVFSVYTYYYINVLELFVAGHVLCQIGQILVGGLDFFSPAL